MSSQNKTGYQDEINWKMTAVCLTVQQSEVKPISSHCEKKDMVQPGIETQTKQFGVTVLLGTLSRGKSAVCLRWKTGL